MNKIATIVLAAGFSKRTGAFKMALPLGDETILQRTCRVANKVSDRVIVVTGHSSERIEELALPFWELVHNPDFEAGMFTSVRKGISALKGEDFFIMPGDYPLVEEHIYRKMLDAFFDSERQKVVMPVHNGRTGHPVLIPSNGAETILEMTLDHTLRDFVYPAEPVKVEVGTDHIFMDIDYIEDYHRIKDLLK